MRESSTIFYRTNNICKHFACTANKDKLAVTDINLQSCYKVLCQLTVTAPDICSTKQKY